MKVAIVIVNYNNASDTLACIESLEKLKAGKDKIITILVDNASLDDSVKIISKRFPKIKVIRSPSNKGFAGGNNLGIKLALKNGAGYIFLLNNDTLVKDKRLIEKLIKPQLDLAAPVVKFRRKGKFFYDFGGKIDFLFGRNYHLESDNKWARWLVKPDYISGVAMMIRARVFRRIGFLDEKYFMYYEDVDFCIRAKKAGYKLGSVNGAAIFHKLSASADKLGTQKLHLLASSQWRFATHHLSKTSLFFAFFYHLYLHLKGTLSL